MDIRHKIIHFESRPANKRWHVEFTAKSFYYNGRIASSIDIYRGRGEKERFLFTLDKDEIEKLFHEISILPKEEYEHIELGKLTEPK